MSFARAASLSRPSVLEDSSAVAVVSCKTKKNKLNFEIFFFNEKFKFALGRSKSFAIKGITLDINF